MVQPNRNGSFLCWHCGRFDSITDRAAVRIVADRHFPEALGSGPLICLACGMTGTLEDFRFGIESPRDAAPWRCALCQEDNSTEDRSCRCCGAPPINLN